MFELPGRRWSLWTLKACQLCLPGWSGSRGLDVGLSVSGGLWCLGSGLRDINECQRGDSCPDKHLSPFSQDVLVQHPCCPMNLGHSHKGPLGTGVVNELEYVHPTDACLHILHGTKDTRFDLFLSNSIQSSLNPWGHSSLVQLNQQQMEV